MHYSLTRRHFLAGASAWAGASLLAGMAEEPLASPLEALSRPAQAGDLGARTPASSGPRTDAHGMIVYSEEYITREMPVALLDRWITPTEHFFVRNNERMPQIRLADWKLSITGEVARPLTLTMKEMDKFGPRSVTNTLECAGNGRAFFQPRIRGVPWSRGGVGNAVFGGPALGFLLRLARVKSTARHVAFRGMAPRSPDPPFVRSIPIEKALDADTIVATEMNGAPLAPEHGYPARVLVPGWIGSASIKWLTEIRVLTHEFEGFFMDSAYRLPPGAPGAEGASGNNPEGAQRGTVITSLPVKSIIAAPADGSTIEPGAPLRIGGAAWAGDSAIARVEISTDGGKFWQPAALGSERARYAWRLWSFDWKPPAEAEYAIFSRATDNQGRAQPLEMPWNPGGYVWNAADRVRVTVGKRA
jgi:DMSO/TMAO reductase YedYZ molybdopterin-dependent catalytic subunit